MQVSFNPLFNINLKNNKNITQPLDNNRGGGKPILRQHNNFSVQDTVSFAGSKPIIAAQTMNEILESSFTKKIDRMQRIATTYLDVLESIASKLKDKGISFDRAYCEPNCVKSAKSSASKVIRSKKLSVPDGVRATLYVNNPYDLSTLVNDILPEFKKRGYILSNVDMTVEELEKRKYGFLTEDMLNLTKDKKKKVKLQVPDLDIRLDKDSVDESVLPDVLKYALSKPQKSGYEDIQMRLVRDFDTKGIPVEHELIILFGPEYANAKHLESEKIYSSLRKFDELNMKFDDAKIGSNAFKAKRYIDLISSVARGKFSQKLFMNAKNINYYDIDSNIPLEFSEKDASIFNTYFSALKDRLTDCYAEIKRSAEPAFKKKYAADERKDKAVIETIRDELSKNFKYLLKNQGKLND